MEETELPRSLQSKTEAILYCTVISDNKRYDTMIVRDEFSKVDSSNRAYLWCFFQKIAKFPTFFPGDIATYKN
jgi:hypothetical protein